jgi:hypothetical protein
MESLSWIVLSFVAFLVLCAILGSFFTVNTAQVAVSPDSENFFVSPIRA